MTRRTGMTLCLTIVALLGAGWCVGEWRARMTDAEMRHRLTGHAVHMAGTLNPEMVKKLSFTAADRGTPAFEFIRKQLTTLGKYLPQRGIYCMARRDAQLVFGPENYPEDDAMASPPGTVYEKPTLEDVSVFTTGRPITFGPITDEYGTFVCALAPVRDPNSGEVLMAVGIDIVADDWNAVLRTARREPMVGSLILLAILLAGAGVRRWRQRGGAQEGMKPSSESGVGSDWQRANPYVGRHISTGLLIGMGALAITFLGVVLFQTWCSMRVHIDSTAHRQARLAVEFDKALGDYVGKHIRPEMETRVARGEFIPEAMSTSFVARSVFDSVRKAFPEAILRFPSTNPRNPANRATPAEESLIRYFEQHPQANVWSGMMEFFERGEKYFVCAIPRRFEAGCLQCHGRPENAPASLRERYGAIAGFGRSAGEVSIDLAAIPVNASYVEARARIWRHMLSALGLCMLFLAGIALLIWADARRRRSAEMAVEKERSFLRLVIDMIPGFVCVKSQEGRFVIVNEGLAKACGTTVQGVEGKRDADFCSRSEQLDSWRRNDLEVLTTGEVKVIPEEPITYPDGATHWFTVTKVPLICEDGRSQLLAIATDITERKRAEEELRESFSMLEATLESTADGLLVVDTAGRIKSFNSQFEELWRIPAAILGEADHRNSLEHAAGQVKDRDAFVAGVQRLYDHPEMEGCDTLELLDGRIIERYSKPQRIGDRVVGRVWSFRDITEKRTAEQRQAALLARVAEINEELTHFAYVVSHDLKAPLRGIKLVTEWLCADYGDKLGDDAKEQLGLLQSRVARMHNLIDGVLQYSRVGRIKEETVEVDLNELIPDIIDGIAPPEHIRIVVEPGLPVIECERTRITQVFQNLMGNAVKFMDKSVGEVRVGCVEDGDLWRFSITDNGPGIAEKYFDRIFHLFQTLSSRDEFESTGVGLALVKKIVEMYGGRVWVESQVGRGSTFLFTFPRKRATEVAERLTEAAVC